MNECVCAWGGRGGGTAGCEARWGGGEFICVFAVCQKDRNRTGATENTLKDADTLYSSLFINLLRHTHTHAHTHTHLGTHTRAHRHIKYTLLKDRPSDLPRRSLLCCLATRLSPTVESTQAAPFCPTDSEDSKSEPVQKNDPCR